MYLDCEPPQRRLQIIVVRHGEPEKYAATDARLSENGVSQIRDFKDEVVARLQDETSRCLVQIFHSTRQRTHQSATIIYDGIAAEIKSGRLTNTLLADTRSCEALQTADPLNRLQEEGVTPDRLMHVWLTTPEEELASRGILTPSQIAHNFRRLVGELVCCPIWPDGISKKIDILQTHETSTAAILGSWLGKPISEQRIEYAGHINIVAPYPGDDARDNPWFGIQGSGHKPDRKLFMPL